jgi:hypothetical protein
MVPGGNLVNMSYPGNGGTFYPPFSGWLVVYGSSTASGSLVIWGRAKSITSAYQGGVDLALTVPVLKGETLLTNNWSVNVTTFGMYKLSGDIPQ